MTTLAELQDSLDLWITQVQGRYINEDWEPVTEGYGAQCWDLAANWSKWLGLPVINTGGGGRWPGWAGNMVDSFPQSPEVDAAYQLISPDQDGLPADIPVWGDTYWWYPKTHVAVLVRDPGSGWLTCMSQNSVPSRGDNPYPNWTTGPTTLQDLPKAGLIGFIRPRTGLTTPEDDMANVPQEEWNAVRDAAYRISGVITDPHAKVLTTADLGAIADAVLDDATDLPGGGSTSPRTKVKFQKQEFNVLGAKLDALAGAIASLAAAQPGVPLTKDEILGQLDKSVKDVLGDYTPAFVKTDSA
jgi:hypothetical protein